MTLAYKANRLIGMKLTLQLQLLPDATQADALRTTVERFNDAATWLAAIAFQQRCANKIALQKLTYYALRERFGLPADTAIRCIAQVVEAYKRNKTLCPTFRPHAAVPFSLGKNIGFKGPDRVSLSTLAGRVIVPYIMGAYQQERFGFAHGQADLVLRRDGKWFLLVTVDVPEGTVLPITDFIGVDVWAWSIWRRPAMRRRRPGTPLKPAVPGLRDADNACSRRHTAVICTASGPRTSGVPCNARPSEKPPFAVMSIM